MVNSELLDKELLSSYVMKVCSTLLTMGHIQGVKPDDMMEFFAVQVQAMLMAPPNYKMFGSTPPVWVMRGFYPGTSIFFKLVIARNDKGTWVKASVPMVKIGQKRKVDQFISVKGEVMNDILSKRMENAVFGAAHEIPQLVPANLCKMPRCMSPKGVTVFNYKKPRNSRTNRKNPDTKASL